MRNQYNRTQLHSNEYESNTINKNHSLTKTDTQVQPTLILIKRVKKT